LNKKFLNITITLSALFLLTSCDAVNGVIDKFSKDEPVVAEVPIVDAPVDNSDEENLAEIVQTERPNENGEISDEANETDGADETIEENPNENSDGNSFENFGMTDNSENTVDNPTENIVTGNFEGALLENYLFVDVVENQWRIQIPDNWYTREVLRDEGKTPTQDGVLDLPAIQRFVYNAKWSGSKIVDLSTDDPDSHVSINCYVEPNDGDSKMTMDAVTDDYLAKLSDILRKNDDGIIMPNNAIKSKFGDKDFVIMQLTYPLENGESYNNVMWAIHFDDDKAIIFEYLFRNSDPQENIGTFSKMLETLERAK